MNMPSIFSAPVVPCKRPDNTVPNTTSLRPLQAGEELTYFYPSTEWTMTQPFTCACGAVDCLGTIDGASTLSPDVLARYVLSPFVRRMLAQSGR